MEPYYLEQRKTAISKYNAIRTALKYAKDADEVKMKYFFDKANTYSNHIGLPIGCYVLDKLEFIVKNVSEERARIASEQKKFETVKSIWEPLRRLFS
jgi:hemerythrin-like domain-containing protein